MLTVWPAATRRGNLLPPNFRTVCASVNVPAPTSASGPTTRLLGLVKASGKPAPDWVEHVSVGWRASPAPAASAALVRAVREAARPASAASFTPTLRRAGPSGSRARRCTTPAPPTSTVYPLEGYAVDVR